MSLKQREELSVDSASDQVIRSYVITGTGRTDAKHQPLVILYVELATSVNRTSTLMETRS